jgi:transposase InsO family protein
LATLAYVDWYNQRRLHGQIGNNTKPKDFKPNDQQPGPLKSWMGQNNPQARRSHSR